MSSGVLHNRHGLGWPPDSSLGRWSVALAGLGIVGTVAVAVAFAAGLERAGSFSDNLLLTGAGVAILAAGVASLATGALALFRQHDHSWLVVVAVLLGLLVTVLMLQQAAEGLGWLQS